MYGLLSHGDKLFAKFRSAMRLLSRVLNLKTKDKLRLHDGKSKVIYLNAQKICTRDANPNIVKETRNYYYMYINYCKRLKTRDIHIYIKFN